MRDRVAARVVALDDAARSWIIGGVRILVGLLWLANVHWKVPPDFGEDTGGGLYKFSESVTRHSPFAPFTWFTEEVILPNFVLFGWITLVVETLLALFLLIGYRTKLACVVGFLISVPIFLSVLYYDRADEWSWAYFMMFGLHLVLIAANAGHHIGVDGVLARQRATGRGATSAIRTLGIVATLVGLAGLYVARGVDVAGDRHKLLGSDAGFMDGDRLVRRWELKFLWFNPLLAVVTIVLGVLLIVGWKRVEAAYVAAAGFAVLAAVVFVGVQTFNYLRDDNRVQTVSTGSNAAFWGALAVGAVVLARAATRDRTAVTDAVTEPGATVPASG